MVDNRDLLTDHLIITKIDETYLHIQSERSILHELYDYFSFFVPDYKFTKAHKLGRWDGKIHLFNTEFSLIYVGLLKKLKYFCKERNYTYEINGIDKDIIPKEEDIENFISSLNLPYKLYPYQYYAFLLTIIKKRLILLSSVNSGKSLLIYLICRYLNKKTLIIVPSIDLVNQLYRNFEEYGYNAEKNVHRIYQGQEKSSDKLITISTWQSIKDLDEEYFSQYNVIIGDEVHTFTGPSLKGIMERTSCSEYKIGMTGTLDDAVCHRLLLEGLFGEIKEIVTAKKLMDIGINTPLNINVIILKHLISERNLVKDSSYIEEIDFIEKHERRNKFIQNLALDKNENILILYKHIDNHGSIIYNNLKKLTNRPIFFINGRVSKDIREEVIKIIDTHSNAIVIATYNTFSTGINIKKLHHLIFASPHKNKKKVIQSIGRLLRKSNGKEICNLYDIADDFSIDGEMNHTLKHLAHRLKSYNSEQFKYKIYKIELNE